MSKKHETTEVVEAQTTALAIPAMDFAADAGMGMEGADKDSFAIPFLTVLQGLSPQMETVEGAKIGKIINTITNELYDEALIIPCAFQRRFIRWAPRSAGGGYKGEYNPVDVETGALSNVRNIDGIYMVDVPEGVPAFDAKGAPLYDHLADTRNHFVLVQSKNGAWQPALLSLSSTQIKKSKRLMSLIQGIEMVAPNGRKFTPPSFSHVYRMKTLKEENSKGSWYGVSFELAGPIEDAEVYAKAKEFSLNVNAGKVEVTPPAPEHAAEDSNDKF